MLVFTNGGGHQGALWGDVACGFAVKKGVAGAVVHGAVRDTDAIRELGFPVWSTHISVEHPEKRGPAAVNVPIVVDGVLVEPGDIIAADADGVVVIPRALLRQAVEGAEARAANEVKIRARIAAGELPLDILGLRAVIEDAGIEARRGPGPTTPKTNGSGALPCPSSDTTRTPTSPTISIAPSTLRARRSASSTSRRSISRWC